MSKVLNTLRESELNQFQEDLAKTYFSTTATQTKPKIPHKAEKDRGGRTWIIFWVTSFLFLLAFAGILLVLDKIDIDIKIMPAILSHLTQADVLPFDKNGEPNRDVIKEIVFFEDASTESIWGRRFVTLSNDVASKKAALGMEFTSPLNMENGLFCFTARGGRGGEEMRLILKDSFGNICSSGINTLDRSWQQFAIDTGIAKNFIEPAQVSYITVELNPAEKEFRNRSKIYLKDLHLKK